MKSLLSSIGQLHSQSGLCARHGDFKNRTRVCLCYRIYRIPESSTSLHFVGTASKLFVLLTRKGLTLGC